MVGKPQDALGHSVGLDQHSLRRQDENIILSVSNDLFGSVCVADGGLGIRNVLCHHSQTAPT